MPPRHQHLFGGLQVKDSSNYVSPFLIVTVTFETFLLSREMTNVFLSFMKILETEPGWKGSKTKGKQESSQSKTHVQAHEPIIPKDRGLLSNPQVSRITVVHVLFEKKHSTLVTSPDPQLAYSKKSQQPDLLRCP